MRQPRDFLWSALVVGILITAAILILSGAGPVSELVYVVAAIAAFAGAVWSIVRFPRKWKIIGVCASAVAAAFVIDVAATKLISAHRLGVGWYYLYPASIVCVSIALVLTWMLSRIIGVMRRS